MPQGASRGDSVLRGIFPGVKLSSRGHFTFGQARSTTTVMKTSKREQLALDTLQAGGFFRYDLVTTYMGRQQFKARLYDSNRHVVDGVSGATMRSLEKSGVIARDWSVSGSTCSVYRLAQVLVKGAE